MTGDGHPVLATVGDELTLGYHLLTLLIYCIELKDIESLSLSRRNSPLAMKHTFTPDHARHEYPSEY